MLNSDINYLAVLVAAVINMAMGAFWYSSAGFAKPWMKLVGKKAAEMDGNANTGYAITTVFALLQGFILAILVRTIGAETLMAGASLGVLLWVGFTASTTISDYLFTGRPIKLWTINTGYYLVVLVINGALLAVWR